MERTTTIWKKKKKHFLKRHAGIFEIHKEMQFVHEEVDFTVPEIGSCNTLLKPYGVQIKYVAYWRKMYNRVIPSLCSLLNPHDSKPR